MVLLGKRTSVKLDVCSCSVSVCVYQLQVLLYRSELTKHMLAFSQQNLWVSARSKWARPFCAKHSSFFGPKRSRLLGPYSKTHPMSAEHASTCLIQSISNHACFTCPRLLLGNFLGLLKALSCICWFFHTFGTNILTLTFDLSSAFLERCCFHGNFACGVALSCRVWTRCGSTHSGELFEVCRPSAQLGLLVFHSWLWAKSNFHFFRPWVSVLLEVKIHSSCTWQPTSWSR